MVVFIIITYFFTRANNFINCIEYLIILYIVTILCITGELFEIMEPLPVLRFIILPCLVTYICSMSKISKKIFRTSLSIILSNLIIPSIFFIGDYLSIYLMNLKSLLIALLSLGILSIILSILSKLKKLKSNNFLTKISKEVLYILRYMLASIASVIICKICDDRYNISENIMCVIYVLCIYFFNYFFNRLGKKEILNTSNYTKMEKIIITLTVLGLLAVTFLAMCILVNAAASTVYN